MQEELDCFDPGSLQGGRLAVAYEPQGGVDADEAPDQRGVVHCRLEAYQGPQAVAHKEDWLPDQLLDEIPCLRCPGVDVVQPVVLPAPGARRRLAAISEAQQVERPDPGTGGQPRQRVPPVTAAAAKAVDEDNWWCPWGSRGPR